MAEQDEKIVGDPQNLDDEQKLNLLAQIKKRCAEGVGADEENRRLHTEDLRFAYDSELQGQWDPLILSMRQGRPSYTFNRVLQPINMVIGDQRQTRPAVKVRPSSENSNSDVADIFGGLWRDIEQSSRAESTYDEQYKHAVAAGFGEMLLLPQYESDESFDQVLRIRNVPNPLTVIRDPESTDPCGGDAMWVIVGERISKEKYEALYPDEAEQTFQIPRDSLGWFTDGMVRVVDYFERIPLTKTIAQLSDGRIIEYTKEEEAADKRLEKTGDTTAATIVRKKTVKTWKVRWCKCDGAQILEGPIVYDWKRIPSVRIPGRYVNIEGRQKYQSLIRHSKDSQRSYNFQKSDAIERSALVPKARYLVTPKQILGYEDIWNSSNSVPRIYMPFNVDKDLPDPYPKREQPIDVPAGAMAMAESAAQDIQATTGMFDPALGNADDMNRVSGKALVTHTRRSDLGTHEFIDNYGKALQLLCEMGLDMIPTVYDSERVVRIIDGSGQEKHVTINGQDESGNIINDLKSGSYDCTVTLGPSYQTARQESLATLLDAAQRIPGLGEVIPDLITKAIDSPDSDEMTRRLRVILIQKGLVQPTKQEQANMPPPPPPNPIQQAEVAIKQAEAQKVGAEAAMKASEAQNAPMEQHKQVLETANKHLSNLLLAKELSLPPSAAEQP